MTEANQSLRYPHESLFTFGTKVLEALGVPPAGAATVSASLVEADLQGVSSHGLVRLPVYTRRLQAGVVNPCPSFKVNRPAGAVALVDGDNGLGAVVGSYAMSQAVTLARETGIGLVGVRGSNHFGMAGFFVRQAVEDGLIGTAVTNAPPNMAPFGGKRRFLGTNPIGIGIPAGTEPPLIVDLSTSVVARGRIIVAAQQNRVIPEGWAIDSDGRPTTDPRLALEGAVLPFGGPKGSALSFVIDLLAGVLTGAAYTVHLNTLEDLTCEQNVGHLFTAMRPDLFISRKAFGQRMDEALGLLRESEPAPGVDQVMLPGELEARTRADNLKNGVVLGNETVEQLIELGDKTQTPFPTALGVMAEET